MVEEIEIPKGWNKIIFGTLGYTYNGLSGKTKDDFGENGKPYIPYTNIFANNAVDVTDFEYVDIKKGEKQNEVKYGDILFTTSSETIEEVGMSSVFLENLGGIYLNSFCFGFRLFDFKKINPEFARYLFREEKIRYSISLLGQGSTRYNLSKTRLKKDLEIIIPSEIDEQLKIAEILNKVDEAILQTEQLIAKYGRIKTGLTQDLLTKGIDENDNIRSEATHNFKDSDIGRIPIEWESSNIGKISSKLRSGVTPKGGSNVYIEEGIMLIRSQNVYPYGFKLDDVAFISEEINNKMKGSELENYDVLLNITGASIGRSTYVPFGFPKANVNQHVCAIKLHDTSLEKALFVSTYFNSDFGQNQIAQNNAGSNREGINYSQIKEIKIPSFKDESEYLRFYKLMDKSSKKIEDELDNLIKLKKIKAGVMQDLLSGKKRITSLLNTQSV